MDPQTYLLGALWGIATALLLGDIVPRLIYAGRGRR